MKNRYLLLIPGIAVISLFAFTSLRDVNRTALSSSIVESQVALESNPDSIQEINDRILLDFSLTEPEVRRQIEKRYGAVSDSQMQDWEQSGKLEMRVIGGEKRYFKNAVANLQRLLIFDSAMFTPEVSALDSFCLEHTAKVIAASDKTYAPVLPQNLVVSYTISVKPDVVPEGTVLRCWLPAPREGIARQKNFKVLSSEADNSILAPNEHLQRTFYAEQKTVKNQPTVFSVKYAIQTSAQYFDIEPSDVLPYDTTSAVYMHYTQERPPHILFSDEIRALGSRIVGAEKNPLRKVERIYQWINDSIPWASALEYCTMANITEYVLSNRHGDCGMQTFLFMSLARSQGVPVKWQSGFMLHPGHVNLHDWCEVFYEGIGWVPLDQSFKLQSSDDEKLRQFYVHGIDAYRLIVNDDFAQELYPPKKFLRSEPYDFQRGEVEWEEGNLYFNQWNWDIDVDYQ
ncbi:transglutaminase-like domain-containing protein [Mangrovibacterium diazotrophicum]|uniref:Transglutaminase-like putative cysteine protease n=1 Tax=Mangrovibacterium diazotrophicum TaxID=1261403 RepID=A0A419W9Q5_9BACT|nr:transglutaminase domain-containing protein [Mangrovibacterium diazotrophicum]RKD92211.1 transglutaminase-like putative cysteine protease [Mangrovibacterium diazotrophicum]